MRVFNNFSKHLTSIRKIRQLLDKSVKVAVV